MMMLNGLVLVILDYSQPENFALAMYSMFSNGVANSSSFDGIEIIAGTNQETMDNAIEALDKKLENYISLHKDWFDTTPRSGDPDPDAGLYPPPTKLFYMNADGEVDESKGILGAFNHTDNSVTSLAELISLSPDTGSAGAIEATLNNWDTASINEKLPIIQYFVHSELYEAVQGGMQSDSGIIHPDPVLNMFTSDNKKENPFIGSISSGSYAEDNFQEATFPLVQEFLAWEREGTVINDDSGYPFTGTQSLGTAFNAAPNQFQQILDLFLQHVEKNVPRYVEDNRSLVDLFSTDSVLPEQTGSNIESALYQDISSRSFDTISVTQNNLNRGISKLKNPVLIDMLNQTVIRNQEFPDYVENDKINVIHGFDPEKNDFVEDFPTLDIRDYELFFKTL